VDSKGVQSTDEKLKGRYFSSVTTNWDDKLRKFSFDLDEDKYFNQSLTQKLYWESIEGCSIDGTPYGEGIGAYVDGFVRARFEYRFTLYVFRPNHQPTAKERGR
jgi:hypothetical protein